jgi:hypothetical protein
VVLAVCEIAQAALVVVQTTVTADTFVRQDAPDENYGTRGALVVTGSSTKCIFSRPLILPDEVCPSSKRQT